MKHKFLVLFLCLGFLSVPGSYAYAPESVSAQIVDHGHGVTLCSGGKTDLTMDMNDHNLRTKNSWFAPIIRQQTSEPGYAWTVQGPITYTKNSKKWPGFYWDAGGIAARTPVAYAKKYEDPWIDKGLLSVIYAHLVPLAATSNVKNLEMCRVELAFETDKDGRAKITDVHEKTVSYNQKVAFKKCITEKLHK